MSSPLGEARRQRELADELADVAVLRHEVDAELRPRARAQGQEREAAAARPRDFDIACDDGLRRAMLRLAKVNED